MRVAFLSYPMLFQRQGGLQIQIKETIAALNQLDIQTELINPHQDQLAVYDLVHVFSAINGNYRIVEAAKDLGKPVVISPLIRPDWTRLSGMRERFLDRLVGRLTGWHIQTTYREIHYCLLASDAIVALGEIEKNSITEAFLIEAEKVSVIPNGIPKRFFEATPALFSEKFNIEPGFVLCVAAINSHKNQLALAEALKDTGLKVVLIGTCLEFSKAYLAQLMAYPHVVYLGSLAYENPLLASAYAAAGVFCLPSLSEVMPLSVLEALAADTPAVMTRNHCMDISLMQNMVREIAPNDHDAIRQAICATLANPVGAKACRASVAAFSWDSVAVDLAAIYRRVFSTHRA
ncbi:MAG: glycosyltransferase family 4 protein [Methylococcaceae bacterium]|nr:glycosyltransferase family 4 protein [Methylococcaceae bacterium]